MTPVYEIQQLTAETFGIEIDDILSPTRRRKIAWPRQVAMMLARQHTGYSLPRLGRLFKRDHSTILEGIRQAERRVANDRSLAATVRMMERRLGVASADPPRVESYPCQRCGARPGMCGHNRVRLGMMM